MTSERPRTFLSGAALVWRRQRVLWWIFVANFFLAHFSTHSMAERTESALSHSAAAGRLVHGFDISTMIQLVSRPESPYDGAPATISASVIVFLLFMLFVTGGVLECYRDDQTLSTTQFFESCGRHFWRFVRLMIYLLLALIPVAILLGIAVKIYNRIDEVSISPFPSVRWAEGALLVILLLLMAIRLWFDMAQVIAVAEDERRMHKALRRAASLLRRNFFSLFWLYLRISVLAWLLLIAGMHIWMSHLPPYALAGGSLVSQLVILFWIGTRLWQRASEMQWYRNYQAGVAPAPTGSPAPVVSSEAAPLTPSTV